MADTASPGAVEGSQDASKVVLVADDESAVRGSVRRILTAHGYRVLVAADGPSALQAAAAHPGRIHLLLSDVVMPGMGGAELARRLQELRPGVAILFMTGYSPEAVERHGVLVAGTALIQKPFTAEELVASVRSALERS